MGANSVWGKRGNRAILDCLSLEELGVLVWMFKELWLID